MKTFRWPFYLIAALALIWHAMGSANFMMQLNPDNLANMPDVYRDSIVNRPIWATVAFGISTFAGVIGAILLLMKRPLASTFFWITALGAAVTAIPLLGGVMQPLVGAGLSVVVGVVLALYARSRLS